MLLHAMIPTLNNKIREALIEPERVERFKASLVYHLMVIVIVVILRIEALPEYRVMWFIFFPRY